MNKVMVKSAFTIGLLAMLLAVPVYGASVNKSIKVAPGVESDGQMTVNGSITVGEAAIVTGGLRTVNGKIRIEADAQVQNVNTVNGSVILGDRASAGDMHTTNGAINLGPGSRVSGAVETTNGRITLEQGSELSGDIANVNGDITLDGARAGGSLNTVNGDVELKGGAVLQGDLVVEQAASWGWGNKSSRTPEIVIGPGSAVRGAIRLDREVKLYISESAQVGEVEGVMTLDDAISFSGDHP